MLESGDDARFIARRLVILASEDIGMADPNALVVAVAAATALEHVGLPEAQLNLAQAVVYLATAPKSNRVALGIWSAREDIQRGVNSEVPAHLRDGHYEGAREFGHGVGYMYPHDDPRGFVEQRYMPESKPGSPEIRGNYYQPSNHGSEREIAEKMNSVNTND
jgi:putative ATPase